MKLVELKFKLTKNLGNYESATLEATAQIAESDSEEACFVKLKTYVEEALAGELGKSEPIKKVKKGSLAKDAITTDKDGKLPVQATPELPIDEPKKKVTKKVTKKAPAKKVKEAKIESYDRANQAHKEEFARVLNIHCDGWKDSKESKVLAKAASTDLVGTEMFKDGDLMESFIAAVKIAMTADDL